MILELGIKTKNMRVVNETGTVALCCLWTPVDHLLGRMREFAPASADPQKSPVVLAGGLYGGGLNIMLRNLHHNPQIDTVVICGKDFSGAAAHLKSFLAGQVEVSEKSQAYEFPDGSVRDLPKLLVRGGGGAYTTDSLLMPAMFERPPRVLDWAGPLDKVFFDRLNNFLSGYRPSAPPASRPDFVELPKPRVETYPSDPFDQTVRARTIVEAWGEILVRLARFGRPVKFRSGKERLELVNVKAVIAEPGEPPPEDLKLMNVSPAQLEDYRAQLVNPELTDGMPYTYGHRMRTHFNRDCLDLAAEDLAGESDSRHAYIALWDNNVDPQGRDSPCLVSVFFRKIEDKIHLMAVFRSHNGARAWPVNCVGLWGLTEHVCAEINKKQARAGGTPVSPGSLIVTSMSLSLDPADLPQVSALIEARLGRPYRMRGDPNGFFRLSVDHEKKELVLHHHSPEGETVGEYREATPAGIVWRLVKDGAVSDLGHAFYLGGQLEKARECLRRGLEYVQDNAALD